MMLARKTQKRSPMQRLLAMREFDQTDLAANRNGHLSQNQKFNIRSGIVIWTIALMGIYLIFIGGTLCGQINRTYGVEGATWFLVVTMITPIIIDLVLLYRQQRRFTEGEIQVFIGQLVKPVRSRKYGKEHSQSYLVLNNTSETRMYNVSGSLHDVFIEGETYSVYAWSFNEKRILSAEHASEA